MDFQKLLADQTCSCGKTHTCKIKHVIIEPNVLAKYDALVADYNNVLLIADQNTYEVFGKEVEKALGDKVASVCVLKRDGILVPNEVAIAEIKEYFTDKIDLIVGVGSGVIQDLCKHVSFEAKLPYHIVATAPSMDGYASVGSALILYNVKVTLNCHVPEAIIADTNIIKDAPMEMIQAGYGDILGKFSCLNDWKLSRVVNNEYFCQFVYDLTMEMVYRVKDSGEALKNRDPEAIQNLMEALIGVGIAMAYVGNSRPASGSEHHLSHYFEVVGLLRDEPYFMHGTDVVYSTYYTQKLREMLLQLEEVADHTPETKEAREANLTAIYESAAKEIIALQDKMGWYEIDRVPTYKAKWNEIKEVLSEVPSCEQIKAYIESVGLDLKEFAELYGEEKIENALKYAKDIKDRYTVLWLYYDLFV